MSKQALKCYVGVGYGNGSQTIITQIDNIGNIVGLDVEPQDIKEIPRDFSISFTCNLNNAAIDYLFGNKRERYEKDAIYRYAHIKKSRKKKQMLRYCKKYNFEVVGITHK